LPRGFRFEGAREVSIRREGKAVILEPVEELSREDWWKSWRRLGKEFLPGGRKQPAMQVRDLELD
jgi:virulence-associated protein VagC